MATLTTQQLRDMRKRDETMESIGLDMVKLTEWKTGKSSYVRLSAIKSCRSLASDAEMSERTRVNTAEDTFFVVESPDCVIGHMSQGTKR